MAAPRTPRSAALLRTAGAFVSLALTQSGCDRRPRPVEPDGERGALAVSVSGLPNGTDAVVQVTGPSGYVRTVTGTELLVGLRPGRYQVRASNVRAQRIYEEHGYRRVGERRSYYPAAAGRREDAVVMSLKL